MIPPRKLECLRDQCLIHGTNIQDQNYKDQVFFFPSNRQIRKSCVQQSLIPVCYTNKLQNLTQIFSNLVRIELINSLTGNFHEIIRLPVHKSKLLISETRLPCPNPLITKIEGILPSGAGSYSWIPSAIFNHKISPIKIDTDIINTSITSKSIVKTKYFGMAVILDDQESKKQ